MQAGASKSPNRQVGHHRCHDAVAVSSPAPTSRSDTTTRATCLIRITALLELDDVSRT